MLTDENLRQFID